MINYLNSTIIFALVLICAPAFAQTASEKKAEKITARAGCSKCVFHSSNKCSLAVKIEGEIYEVEGSSLKDHGKPRAKHGLCRVERKAEISGKIEGGKFLAYDFKLLPMDINELPLMNEDG